MSTNRKQYFGGVKCITVKCKTQRRSMDEMSRKCILEFLTTSMLGVSRNNGRERRTKFGFFLTALCWLQWLKRSNAKGVGETLLTNATRKAA